jgi:hypothetical protein
MAKRRRRPSYRSAWRRSIFNARRDRTYAPVIEALGYEPVHADRDTGSMIITQMIERLYFADWCLPT